MGFGSMLEKLIHSAEMQGIISPVKQSTPEVHDVTVEGIKKRFDRGTNVSYSRIRTSSKGLLTDVKLEKKTLLGS